MPFKIVEEQAAFKFTVNGAGLPMAPVVQWGNGVWVKCCSLCGMLHEKLGGQTEGEYEPNCIVRVTHPKVYAAWQKAHPDSAQHTRVMLVSAEEWAALIPPLAIVEKPNKRKTLKQKRTRKAA